MARQLSFSAIAERDINDISDYTLEKFGKSKHRKYIEGFFTELGKRVADPESLSQREHQLAEYIGASADMVRSFLYGKHRCYFTFNDTKLRVLMLVHSARDKTKAFQELVQSSSN